MENKFTYRGITATFDEDTRQTRYFTGGRFLGMFDVADNQNWIEEAIKEIDFQVDNETFDEE